MRIDCHVHLFDMGFLPASWFDVLARSVADRKRRPQDAAAIRPGLEAGLVDPDGALMMADMDAAEVDACVCMALDFGVALGAASVPPEAVLEHYAEIERRYPGRFFAFASIDPRRPQAAQVIRQAFRDLGLRGLKLYPPAGFDPAGSECMPLYQLCIEYGRPVLFHTGSSNFPMRLRYGNPVRLGDVQAAFPELEIVLGHAGYPFWWREAIAIARRNPNVYLELSQWQQSAMDEPMAVTAKFAEMSREVGTHRLLFGSDRQSGPRFSGDRSTLKSWVQWFEELPQRDPAAFADADTAAILGGNAAALLRI